MWGRPRMQLGLKNAQRRPWHLQQSSLCSFSLFSRGSWLPSLLRNGSSSLASQPTASVLRAGLPSARPQKVPGDNHPQTICWGLSRNPMSPQSSVTGVGIARARGSHARGQGQVSGWGQEEVTWFSPSNTQTSVSAGAGGGSHLPKVWSAPLNPGLG